MYCNPLALGRDLAYCHDPFPELSPICSPQLPSAGLLPFGQEPTRCTRIISDHTQLDPFQSILIALQLMANKSVGATPPWPQRCSGLPRSCGHHVMIMQPCVIHATLSAGHLAGSPGT